MGASEYWGKRPGRHEAAESDQVPRCSRARSGGFKAAEPDRKRGSGAGSGGAPSQGKSGGGAGKRIFRVNLTRRNSQIVIPVSESELSNFLVSSVFPFRTVLSGPTATHYSCPTFCLLRNHRGFVLSLQGVSNVERQCRLLRSCPVHVTESPMTFSRK
jgi:hypothetical protein